MVQALQPRWLRLILGLFILAILNPVVLASGGEWTIKHEQGRCAIRGHCGKKSFFGGQLPCPDNDVAQQPEDKTRTKLVAICGEKWSTGPLCCDNDQVSNQDSQDKSYIPLTRSLTRSMIWAVT